MTGKGAIERTKKEWRARKKRQKERIRQKEVEWQMEETQRTCDLIEEITLPDGRVVELHAPPRKMTKILIADEYGRLPNPFGENWWVATDTQNAQMKEITEEMVRIAELIAEKVIQ